MLNQEEIKKMHCGVHQAPYEELLKLMPELKGALKTFPDNPYLFTWDVKVHMLMPNQYPCMPNWHYDNVPREDGIQKFNKMKTNKPMYMWLSNGPLTQFEHGFIEPRKWVRFTQEDGHRGTPSGEFIWRVFIRASHKDILPPKQANHLRRHCQVYTDKDSFQW